MTRRTSPTATGATYTLLDADLGKTLKDRPVTFDDDGGNTDFYADQRGDGEW